MQSHSEEVRVEATLLAVPAMQDAQARVGLVAPHLVPRAEAELFAPHHHAEDLAEVAVAVDSEVALAETHAIQASASTSIAL